MITKNISDLFKALVLTMIQVLGDDKAILVGVGDDMEYVNDKATGKRLGTKYTVVCPKAMYATVTVKVPDAVPIATQEALAVAATTDTPMWVTFEGFKGRLYAMRGEVGLTCRADKAVVVAPAPAKKERGAGV